MSTFWEDLATSALPGLFDAGLGYLGAQADARAATEAAKLQADAIRTNAEAAVSAGMPFGVGGAGGTAQFDEDTRTGLLQLSPELQDIYQGALIRSGMFGTQADKYTSMDPFAAADLFYQQGQPLIDKERDLRRTDMETRLLAQGRLGSSGGALEQEALETSFATADNQRRADSFTQAQNLISTLLGREKGDLGTATGLLDIPLQYANVGRGIGGNLGNIAASGLASQAAAEENLANTIGAGGSTLGNIAGAVSGLFRPQPAANQTLKLQLSGGK